MTTTKLPERLRLADVGDFTDPTNYAVVSWDTTYTMAEGLLERDATAITHRYNAFPALVEALRAIAHYGETPELGGIGAAEIARAALAAAEEAADAE